MLLLQHQYQLIPHPKISMDGYAKANKKMKKKVANFIIDFTKELGSGQYGKVFQAVNQENHETVAVKIIDKQQIYEDNYIKNALIRQIEIMKNLKNPNIIQFIDIQETPNNIYIFQQLAGDGTLYQILRKHARLDQKTALGYIIQLLSGLSELIKHGIIHRDIKLSNMLIKGNMVKIGDFGFSRYSDTVSSMSSAVGTPMYMAPQVLCNQEQSRRYTYKCDIWSFGVLCFELVTGTAPWKNTAQSDFKELFAKIKQQSLAGIKFPSDIEISENYKDLVRGCLKFQEKDRFDWYQIYHHKLFQHKFKETGNSLQENFILTEIRLKVHSNNINLQKFMSKMPQKLTEQEFCNLLKTLDDVMTQKQAINLFKLFAKDANEISKATLLSNLENHGIKLKGLKSKAPISHEGTAQMVQNLIQIITKNVQEKQIDLFEMLNNFQAKSKNMLYKQQFGEFIKTLYPAITAEQTEQLFKFFNPQKLKGIRYNAFYEKLCKVVQVPAVKDQKISKQIRKMEERKKQ